MQLVENSFSDLGLKIRTPKAIVIIGASTGGPAALAQIIPKLSKGLDAAIIVIQHMRPGFTTLLANQLNDASELAIDEAGDAQPLTSGSVLVAPGDCSVTFEQSQDDPNKMYLLNIETVAKSAEQMRKRVDTAMASAAKHFGKRTIGVLLTGLGDDGRLGMKEIRDCGGRTIVQDQPSSVVFDMPCGAIELGVVDEILPLWSISDRIAEMVGEL